MAKLTRDDVLKLARLAKLKLSNDEAVQFTDEINSILAYVEQLQALDLDGYEPTYQVTGLVDVTRPDETVDYGVDHEGLFKNLPASEDGQIKVRRII